VEAKMGEVDVEDAVVFAAAIAVAAGVGFD
jgi:hypothetical protein